MNIQSNNFAQKPKKKQLKYSFISWWINTTQQSHKEKCYSGEKRNYGIGKNVDEPFMVMKMPDTKCPMMDDSIPKKCSEQANPYRGKVDQWFPRAGRRKEQGVTTEMFRDYLGDNEVILKLDGGGGFTTL